MSEQTLKVEDLPLMDDFTEESSLIVVTDEKTDQQTDEELAEAQRVKDQEIADKQKADDDKKAADEAEQAEQDKLAAEAKEAEDAKKAEKDKKSVTDPKKKEDTSEEASDSSVFYDAVTTLTGIELDVDYGELDPLSPEGVAKREQTLAEEAIASQMDFLEKSFPRAYRVLQHEANGGSVDDLFKPGFVDYSKIELTEEDTDQQKKILRDYYLDKGIPEKRADLLVEADEDAEGGTFKAATDALKERVTVQETRDKKVLADQETLATEQKQQDNAMIQVVTDIASSGKIGNFQIAKADQEKFASFALQNVRRDGKGGYSFVVPMDNKSVNNVLEQAYFSFKGGDLTKLIAAKATTKAANRLKLNVKSSRKKPDSTTTPSRKDQKKLAGFEDYTVDE